MGETDKMEETRVGEFLIFLFLWVVVRRGLGGGFVFVSARVVGLGVIVVAEVRFR